jgi:hypothetical protein
LTHSETNVETSGTHSAYDAHVQQKTDPNDSRSSWLFTVESGFLRKIVILNLLLGVCSAAYTIDLGRGANPLTMSYAAEGQIIVSGDIDQQRDAVLANFARYSNRLRAR